MKNLQQKNDLIFAEGTAIRLSRVRETKKKIVKLEKKLVKELKDFLINNNKMTQELTHLANGYFSLDISETTILDIERLHTDGLYEKYCTKPRETKTLITNIVRK
tara:strand:- start:243 stop:557 length:315 start_codon:yes stop_codon:yes gene_type:complete